MIHTNTDTDTDFAIPIPIPIPILVSVSVSYRYRYRYPVSVELYNSDFLPVLEEMIDLTDYLNWSRGRMMRTHFFSFCDVEMGELSLSLGSSPNRLGKDEGPEESIITDFGYSFCDIKPREVPVQ